MMSSLARELMDDLELDRQQTQESYAKSQLDTVIDLYEDGDGCPIPGTEMCRVGKYKNKMTMWEVYSQDKSYLQWIRTHVDHKKSGTEMKRLRLYIEYMDTNKKERIKRERPRGSTQQLPIRPRAKASPRVPGTTSIRRHREEGEWTEGRPSQNQMEWSAEEDWDQESWDQITEGFAAEGIVTHDDMPDFEAMRVINKGKGRGARS
jgi:hypothetical protein